MALRQRSTHLPAAGDPGRQAAANRLFAILNGAPEYHAAVARLKELDELREGDWRPVAQSAGFGDAQFLQQDGGGALLANQLIPADVDEVERHVRDALQQQHPAASRGDGYGHHQQYERRREAELESAVRRCVELGSDMTAELQRRSAVLDAVSESLMGLTRQIREELSPQHIVCTPFEHVHVAYFAAIRNALELEDTELPVRLALGAIVAGDLPAIRAWEAADVPRPLGLDYDSLPHRQWNGWLEADILERASEPRGAAEAVSLWARTQEELDLGRCDGPWTVDDLDAMYGADGWRGMRCFGVEQGGALRACDDAAESLHNDASNQRDKLRCTQADAPARCADRFAERKGRGSRGWSLLLSTDDLDGAYRRVLVATPGHGVSMQYVPDCPAVPGGGVRGFTRAGFCFGMVSAVLSFNSVPACTASAARRLLGLPTDHYFDDFWLLVLEMVGSAGQEALDAHHTRLGYPLSLKKRKTPALARKFGGVVTDFTRLAEHGEVQVYVDEERRQKLIAVCEEATGGLLPRAAERLCGKLRFSLSWSVGRVGLAALQPLQRRAESKARWVAKVTAAIERALRYLIDVLRVLPPRTLLLDLPSRPPVLVWTDAMYEHNGGGEPAAEGGFVVVEPAEPGRPLRVHYADEVAGSDVMRRFVPDRRQYIGQLEKLYAVVPYTTLPHVFEGRHVIHFIDNTWALAALVKGYATAIDSGLIVNAFHALNVGLRADVFFEYVRSKANIADLPSRGALKELLHVLRRLGMRREAVRVGGVFPPFDSWAAPASAWLQAAQERPKAQVRPDPEATGGQGKRRRRAPGHSTGDQRKARRNAAASTE